MLITSTQRSLQAGFMLALALTATGCVVLPPTDSPSGGSVNSDLTDYLQREWPLTEHGHCSARGCGEVCQQPACDDSCFGNPSLIWQDDWDQHCACGHRSSFYSGPRRQPTVPLEPGPPGRFFPAPTHPAFQPQAVTPIEVR